MAEKRISWIIPLTPSFRCFASHKKLWESHNVFDLEEKWCPICSKLFFWRKK